MVIENFKVKEEEERGGACHTSTGGQMKMKITYMSTMTSGTAAFPSTAINVQAKSDVARSLKKRWSEEEKRKKKKTKQTKNPWHRHKRRKALPLHTATASPQPFPRRLLPASSSLPSSPRASVLSSTQVGDPPTAEEAATAERFRFKSSRVLHTTMELSPDPLPLTRT